MPLTPKVFDTLLYLVEHRHAVLEKDELLKALWPDVVVEEKKASRAGTSSTVAGRTRRAPRATVPPLPSTDRARSAAHVERPAPHAIAAGWASRGTT